MSPAAAKRLRLLASALSLLVVAVLVAGGWFYFRMRASLPLLDGTAKITGLTSPATVTRDALGVPTIQAGNRTDVARALGWLHAQDRFFQMDLLRRRAAGELAELFGQAAVPLDRSTRLHGFRALAQKIFPQLPAKQRALLEAYTIGVNAGLTALNAKPFEYLVLRTDPQPWRVEDSLLVNFAMWLDLQDSTGRYERTLMTLRDQFGAESLAFFAPLLTPADAALDGTTAPAAPPPGPQVIDLRRRPKSVSLTSRAAPAPMADFLPRIPRDAAADIGSNAFALGGAHTANGAGLLANDMHLGLAVPNIWYRASLEYPGHKITGTTLPGTPVITTGSNGRVAWGFTVAYVDSGDLIALEPVPGSHSLYRGADRDTILEVEHRKDTIRVKGGDPVHVEYSWTIWGPIVGRDERNHALAYHWIGHDPAASDLTLVEMEDATDVASAVEIAHRAGMPEVNFIAADTAGKVAWTVAGRLPKRMGYDGRLPTNWAFGDRRWDGYLKSDEVPTIISPAADRVWSANQREVGGDAPDFASALRAGLRQDPDVILVGEMRDLETISTALTAAETGHLVFATLHTQSSSQTVDRIIDVFPPGQQHQVRMQLSVALQGIVTQQLIPTADGSSRTVATEVLVPNPAIRNLIREGKTHQIYSAIQTSGSVGMQTMDSDLARLVRAGKITRQLAEQRAAVPEELRRLLGGGAPAEAGAGYGAGGPAAGGAGGGYGNGAGGSPGVVYTN